jgi:hypothetical protein
MATIDAYGVRFIGNDLVLPQPRRQLRVDPVQQRRFVATPEQAPAVTAPRVQQAVVTNEVHEQEQSTELFSAVLPVSRHERVYERALTRRTALVALSVIVAVGALLFVIPRATGIAHAANLDTSKLALGIRDEMHPASQSSFTMPAHSVLVKNSIASAYVDSVEGQPITIHIGTNTVIPLPTNIASWIKTSDGPERGTTLLSVNVPSVSKYVASAVQNIGAQSGASAGVAADQSAAVSQIAKELLKYNGVTVTIPTAASDAQGE